MSPLCRVGGMSRLRSRSLHHARLRVQYPYEQAFRQIDRSGVLYCGRHGPCCGRSPGRGVLPWRYCHLTGRGRTGGTHAPRKQDRKLRLHHRAVFVPPFVPFAPLALYDIARRVRREHAWVALGIGSAFAFALVADLRGGALTTRTLLLTAILSVAATLLSLRTAQLEREQERMRRTRDKLQERALHSSTQPRPRRPPGLRSRARDARRTRPHRARDPR